MIREVKIQAQKIDGTGAVDKFGKVGPVQYLLPVMPLPDNMLTNKLEASGEDVFYVVTFEDGQEDTQQQ